jgi:hypothetical protein
VRFQHCLANGRFRRNIAGRERSSDGPGSTPLRPFGACLERRYPRAITGSLMITSNFFAISTCSYLRPLPGVLWPVIESEILFGDIAGKKLGFQVVAKRMVRREVFGVAEINGVTSMVRIFNHTIHPFVDLARDIGSPFAVLVLRDVSEQQAMTVFGDLLLHMGDQPFHNLGMQWHIPAFVALDRATGFPIILTDKQKPLPGMTYSRSPFFTKLKSRVLQSAISDTRHPL